MHKADGSVCSHNYRLSIVHYIATAMYKTHLQLLTIESSCHNETVFK